jgi:hypothetical protein
MREVCFGKRNLVPGQALDVGHAWSVGRRIPDRRLIGVPRRWERRVDGVESVPIKRVWHACRLTVRRDNIDGLQGDDLRRRDTIGSPVPVGRSEVLGYSYPMRLIVTIGLGNVKSVLLQHLLKIRSISSCT